MENEIFTLKLDTKEAFILFKLMGFDSFIGYTNPFSGKNRQSVLDGELLRIKNNLLLDGILIQRGRELCIEPSTYTLLQACKLSENIVWLHLNNHERLTDSYFYISARQVIEVAEYFDSGSASIEFTLLGDHEDFFNELERRLIDINKSSSPTQKYEVNIHNETYQYLLNNYDNLSQDELVTYFVKCENISITLSLNFIQALKNHSKIGQLVFINKSKGVLDGIRFLLSEHGQWILTENDENRKLPNLKNVSSADFLKEFFDAYVRSFKH